MGDLAPGARRRVAVAAVAVVVACAPRPASAQEQPRQQHGTSSIAERLFLEGKALMQERQYERACEKLKASYDLDRTATGTLLNLALCHEQINRPATAWAEFRQVAAESAGRREDRVLLAREHEAKLASILSQVRIVVPPAARVEGLTLALDGGAPIGEAAWGTEVPIDPGRHVIAVSAPGKVTRPLAFVVGAVSDKQVVTVEPLVDPPPAVAGEDAAEQARLASLRTRRVVGLSLGGAGLLAAGAGLAFGALASGKNGDATEGCPNDVCESSDARDDARSALSSAKTFATLSTITVVAGGALLVSGVALFLTSRAPSTNSTAAQAAAFRVVPAALPGGGGLFFSGEL